MRRGSYGILPAMLAAVGAAVAQPPEPQPTPLPPTIEQRTEPAPNSNSVGEVLSVDPGAVPPTQSWVDNHQGPPEVAWVGRFSGREEIRRLFGIIAETTDRSDPDLRPTFKEIVAQGDTVISTGTDRVRFLPGGRVCDAWWFHVFKFRDGKIVEMREYFDNTAALSACSR